MNAAALQHRGRELDADTEFLFLQRDRGATRGAVGAPHRNENFAARQEAGLLAADGHQIGLGEDLDQAIVLLGIDGEAVTVILESTQQTGAAGQQIGAYAEQPVAVAPRRQKIGAQLVYQRLGHLGHRHLQHDLLGFGNLQQVHHLGAGRTGRRAAGTRQRRAGRHLGVACRDGQHQAFVHVAHKGVGNVFRRLGLDGAGDHAGQDDRIGRRAHLDAFFRRQQLENLGFHARMVDVHVHIDGRGAGPLAPDDEVGRAIGLAQQVQLGGADEGDISHVRIAQRNARHGRGHAHQRGLADGQIDRRPDRCQLGAGISRRGRNGLGGGALCHPLHDGGRLRMDSHRAQRGSQGHAKGSR